MKKIPWLVVAAALLVGTSNRSLPEVYGKSTDQLVVIPYDSDKNLDSIYPAVEKVIDIIKPPETDQPLVLAFARSQQVQDLKKQGFQVDIVDPDIQPQRYIYVFATNPNHINRLQQLGEVRPITKQRLMVKLEDNQTFNPTGIYSSFYQLPLAANRFAEPVYSANRIPPQMLTSIHLFKQSTLYLVLLVLTVTVLTSVFLYLKKRVGKQDVWKIICVNIAFFVLLVAILVFILL